MAHLADSPRSVLLWDSAPGLTNSEKYQVVGEERSPPGVGNLTQRILILCSIVGCLLTVGGLYIRGNSTLFTCTFNAFFCFPDSFYFQVFFLPISIYPFSILTSFIGRRQIKHSPKKHIRYQRNAFQLNKVFRYVQ